MKKLTYLAVLEPSSTGYGVFFPDLLGCISVGNDLMDAYEMAKEALELHVYGMEKDKEVLPKPSKQLDPKDFEGCLIVPITIYPELS